MTSLQSQNCRNKQNKKDEYLNKYIKVLQKMMCFLKCRVNTSIYIYLNLTTKYLIF